MRVAPNIEFLPLKDIGRMRGMQRLDERMLGFGDVGVVIALNGLVEKRKADQEHDGKDQQTPALSPQPLGPDYSGFHRSTGLRAAATSSTRLVRVP